MRLLKKSLRVLVFIFFTLVILFSWLFTRVDRTPYKEKAYYSKMDHRMDSVDWKSTLSRGDTLQAGWAKVNITPPVDSVPLAGYGARWGALFEKVRDSVWVRTFVFDNGREKIAYVALDLLIVPPEVIATLKKEMGKMPIPLDQVYFTATHSHSSFGGWAPGIVGKLFSGAFNPQIVHDLANAIRSSIQKADNNKSTAQLGYFQQKAGKLVKNRLLDKNEPVDPWIRSLKISKTNDQTAVLTTFTAHATCFGISFMELSGDYPAQLVKNLEASPQIDFAAFSAGAMGSHKPTSPEPRGGKELKNYIAQTIATKIKDTLQNISTSFTRTLGSFKIHLPLREPHIRIAENWRVRPWVFYQVYGDYPSSLTSIQLGNITFLGTPCDYSGMLIPKLLKNKDHNNPVLVTSFNGGYIGYITPDQYYDLNAYETRVMNWFGPYNGAYLTEMMSRILKNMNNSKR